MYTVKAAPAGSAAVGFAMFRWPWLALVIAAVVVIGAVVLRLVSKARRAR